MLKKATYHKIASDRKEKARLMLFEKIKFFSKLYPIFFMICLIIFFSATRTSSNPENRIYPFWKLTLDILGYVLFLLIMAFFVSEKSIIARFRKLERYKRDYIFLQNIFSTNQRFVFYLRDYKSGRSTSTYYAQLPGGNSGTQQLSGSSQMGELTKKVNKYLPVVLLDNENEKTDNYSGIPYYTTNDDWYQDFEYLAQKCFLMIIDYSLEFENSINIDAEIDFMIEHHLKIMVCAKTEHLDALFTKYPGLKANMLFHIPITVVQTGPVFGPKQDAFNTVSLAKEVKLFLKSIAAEQH
jgi:hypothetical protein